jgi:pimeloyl-ACP methyl ester carboxylesterase
LNQDIPIKITDVNGCNIRYFDYDYENQATQPNDCKKLMFSYMLGASTDRFLYVAPTLSESDFRVVAPDIIGFGYSALLHKSDISQLSLKNFNQMIDITSELFIVDPETA